MKDKVTMIYGDGGNEVRIPSMMFKTFEEGFEYAKTAFNREPDTMYTEEDTGLKYACWDLNYSDVYGNEEGEGRLSNSNTVVPAINSFFSSYYGGCGQCTAIVVNEVLFNTILGAFDLD